MKIHKTIVIEVEADHGLGDQVDAANGDIFNTKPRVAD